MKPIKAAELRKIKDCYVESMVSSKGNDVPNKFIITLPGMEIFQSYRTTIAVKFSGGVVLDENYWDYSVITSKYRNQFLGCDSAECKRRIGSGGYLLANLN